MKWLESTLDGWNGLWHQAVSIWLDGGWAMIAIAVIALVMFGMGMHINLELRAKGFLSVPEKTWRRWIDRPYERSGPIGDMLDFVTGGKTLAQTQHFFEQLRTTESKPFERDLRVMRICVSAAPLVGLLGTVTGMLATFGALSTGSGGEKTMQLIAAGISEALITTETGLVVALPGLFFQYQLARKHQRYKAFLAHLETACNQVLHRKLKEGHQEEVREVARREVARTVYRRLREREAMAIFEQAMIPSLVPEPEELEIGDDPERADSESMGADADLIEAAAEAAAEENETTPTP